MAETPAAPLTPRLFFALWPDDALRHRLHALVRTLKSRHPARWVPPERLHLTLHYLGRLPVADLEHWIGAAEAVPVMPFELRLDRLGVFSRPRVLWLGADRAPPPLQALHDALTAGLEPLGYRPHHEQYRPHVTLARKWRGAPPPQQEVEAWLPVDWSVTEFVLVESRDTPSGVDYRVIRRFGAGR